LHWMTKIDLLDYSSALLRMFLPSRDCEARARSHAGSTWIQAQMLPGIQQIRTTLNHAATFTHRLKQWFACRTGAQRWVPTYLYQPRVKRMKPWRELTSIFRETLLFATGFGHLPFSFLATAGAFPVLRTKLSSEHRAGRTLGLFPGPGGTVRYLNHIMLNRQGGAVKYEVQAYECRSAPESSDIKVTNCAIRYPATALLNTQASPLIFVENSRPGKAAGPTSSLLKLLMHVFRQDGVAATTAMQPSALAFCGTNRYS